MARPMPAPLLAAFEGQTAVAGECLVLRARDGTVLGFTSFDEAQVLDLTDDGGPAPVTCALGMALSAITLACGLDASFAEVRGPLGPGLTRTAIDAGTWKDAEAWLVRVSPGIAGYAPVLAGKVREARNEDPGFVLEIRNQADGLNQSLEQLITGYCRLRFGSAECGATPVEAVATVSAVTDSLRFEVSYSGSHADRFFNLGELEFTSGALAGAIAENLFSFAEVVAGTGQVVLFAPLPQPPEVGDGLILRQGCFDVATGASKTRPACMAFDNMINFDGFPDVPGSDQVLRYPNPGA